jgi:hypothetical protein
MDDRNSQLARPVGMLQQVGLRRISLAQSKSRRADKAADPRDRTYWGQLNHGFNRTGASSLGVLDMRRGSIATA